MKTFLWLIAAAALALVFLACQGHTGTSSGGTTVVKTAPADSGKTVRVVVKPITGPAISESEAVGLEGKFCNELARNKKIELVCAEDLKAILANQDSQIRLGTCEEETCLAQMAKAASADALLVITVGRVGDTFTVNASLADGKNGKVKTRFAQEVASGKVEDLLPAMEALAGKVSAEF